MQKIVSVSFPGNKRVDVEMDGTIIKTDQKKVAGGDESAPEPFQLFLASLASCAGIYAVQFCHARNIDTSAMSLTMACDFDPEVKRFTKMTLDLKLPGDFPENLKPAIIRSMDLCAVKKHIVNPPEFEIITS